MKSARKRGQKFHFRNRLEGAMASNIYSTVNIMSDLERARYKWEKWRMGGRGVEAIISSHIWN